MIMFQTKLTSDPQDQWRMGTMGGCNENLGRKEGHKWGHRGFVKKDTDTIAIIETMCFLTFLRHTLRLRYNLLSVKNNHTTLSALVDGIWISLVLKTKNQKDVQIP